MPIAPRELIVLAVVVLLVFGSKRLPEIGRSLGQGLREFKESVSRPAQAGLPASDGAHEPSGERER